MNTMQKKGWQKASPLIIQIIIDSILVQLGGYCFLEGAVVGAGNPGHHAAEAVLTGPGGLGSHGYGVVEDIHSLALDGKSNTVVIVVPFET